MEDQVVNSSDLMRMPVLVIEEILSNVLNLTSVSRTCKILYEIVCYMEKRKPIVISIKPVDRTGNSARLTTIDDDAVFASIMNSRRRITEIRLDLASRTSKLNERQLERITAIMERSGTSVTSLILRGNVLSSNEIIELLSLTPKLETLKFDYGTASGNATKSLHLPNLKTLEMRGFAGLLGVVNLLPAGSLNYFSCHENRKHKSEILKTVLTTQHNIKSLTISNCYDPRVFCVNHLQLEKLELRVSYKNNRLVEILRCHRNLKELSLCCLTSVSAFELICNNLKKLETFKVNVDGHEPQGKHLLVMLKKLKNLQDFSTNYIDFPDDEVQLEINSLEKLEIKNIRRCYRGFNEMVHSMARIFTNLTDLKIKLKDFSQLSIVLSQCTKLIRLTSHITQPEPQQLAEKRFPNIRQLSICTNLDDYDFNIIISIVRAMPNLKSLSLPRTTIIFNVEAVKEFIRKNKDLDDLHLNYIKLDHGLSTTDDFVNTVRCLSDHLKTYRLKFFSSKGNSYVRAVKNLLSNEFKVRDDPNDPWCFVLHKGDLTYDELMI